MNGDRGEFDPLFRENLGAPHAAPPPAGWWRRVAARLVDTVLMSLPMLVIELVVRGVVGIPISEPSGEIEPVPAAEPAATLPGDMLLAFLLCAAWVAYETVFLARWGQTPGKMLLGVVVVPAIEPGRGLRLPASAAATRALLLNLVTAVVWAPQGLVLALAGVTLLAMLWPLWDYPRRQGLHDKLVSTVVVRATPQVRKPPQE